MTKSFPKGECWVVYEGKTNYFLWADEGIERGKANQSDPIVARILDNNNNNNKLPVFLTLCPIQVMISVTLV